MILAGRSYGAAKCKFCREFYVLVHVCSSVIRSILCNFMFCNNLSYRLDVCSSVIRSILCNFMFCNNLSFSPSGYVIVNGY